MSSDPEELTPEGLVEDDEPDDFDGGECGLMPDGTCSLAGTEWCDWDCPYSDEEE
jgi:hypothetical protein